MSTHGFPTLNGLQVHGSPLMVEPGPYRIQKRAWRLRGRRGRKINGLRSYQVATYVPRRDAIVANGHLFAHPETLARLRAAIGQP